MKIADIDRTKEMHQVLSKITDHKQLILVACDFAQRVAKFTSDSAAQKAIDTARAYVAGTATIKECQRAAEDASAYRYYSDRHKTQACCAYNAAAHAAYTVFADNPTLAALATAEAAYDAMRVFQRDERKWQLQHFIEKVSSYEQQPY